MGWVINLAYVNYLTDGTGSLQPSYVCFHSKLSVLLLSALLVGISTVEVAQFLKSISDTQV